MEFASLLPAGQPAQTCARTTTVIAVQIASPTHFNSKILLRQSDNRIIAARRVWVYGKP
jgi:hypothetical protein